MSDPNPDPAALPAARLSFWQRRVVAPILQQLTQGITPEKIALTLAVGTAFAFFPILGTTTLLCLFVGILLKLNQPLIQLVNALCTLPHLLVIYCLFRLGGFIFGVHPFHASAGEFIFHAPHAHFNFLTLLFGIFGQADRPFLHRIEVNALHAIVAWAIIAPIWTTVVYWGALPMLRGVAKNRAEAAMKALDLGSPEHPVP